MRRTFAVVSLSLLLILGVAGSSVALPDGRIGSETYWYSDDTFTTVVGERFMECNGYPYETGTRTVYASHTEWYCQDYSPVPSPCGFWVCDWPTIPNYYNNCQCAPV